MNKIISFFYPKGEVNLFDRHKTKAFIYIQVLGFFLISFLIIFTLLFPNENFWLIFGPALFLLLFMIFNLFLLKKTNIKLVGNIFSVGVVLLIAAPLNILDENINVLYKFLGGFYTILATFTVSALFATRRIIILNFFIVLLTTARVYFFGTTHFPDLNKLLTTGYIEHTITLFVIALVIYYVNKFSESAITEAEKEAETNKKQNKILLRFVEGITVSSDEVYQASEQLSNMSFEISVNATEQATTTEEISASVEEILTMISSNVENAEKTAETAERSAEEMKKSNEIFMETINLVSEISEKIEIIAEIADKTDILSINAAIEAARAGDAGKGFAVVAQEIRKLADKTKKASQEINELSKKGQEISSVARDKLATVIPEVVYSAQLVKDIVVASKEQKAGVEGINNSMLQLTEISNKNSSLAENLSASAEELSAQAEKLKSLIASIDSQTENS